MVGLYGDRQVSLHFLDESVDAPACHKVVDDAFRIVHDTRRRAKCKDLHLMLDLRRCSQLLLQGSGFHIEVTSNEKGVTNLETVSNDLIKPRDRIGATLCVSIEGDHIHNVQSRDVEQSRTSSPGNEINRTA
jgi:hypothetical protein